MSKFASETKVPVAKSKQEIEAIVTRYGAHQVMIGSSPSQAMAAFTMEGRQVRMIIALPDRDSREFTHHSQGARTEESAKRQWEQACRQRWRALALVIKAKLEAVASGISVFEDEFLANIVMPNGRTIGDEVRPKITEAYESGNMPPLLPDYSGGNHD